MLHQNTLHIDCKAAYFADVTSASEFIELLQTPQRKHTPKRLFLGGGSNMLFTSSTFPGIVVHNSILGKEIVSESDHEIIIKVGGGEDRDDFVWRTIDKGLYGIENLVSIPGNVAAAPIQNIGAYGSEVKSAVVNVGGISLETGTYETVSHKDCQFGYRSSVFKHALKGDFFITDVTFRFQHYDHDTYAPIVHYGNVAEELTKSGITHPTPREVAATIASIRAAKMPDSELIGTAGSFFKNIILEEHEYQDFVEKVQILQPGLHTEFYALDGGFYKIPTGRILDHVLGYRGYRAGNVGCREKQALCLVNYGGATGQEMVAFVQKLQRECQEKLGVSLEPEVNFIQ